MAGAPALAAPRAGFVTRLGATVVDTIVLALMLRGTTWFFLAWRHALRRFAPPIDGIDYLLVFWPLVAAAYHVAFWRLRGQTPGKWVFGVQVVAVDGAKLSVWQATVRALGYLVSALPFYLGFLWILGPQRRGFHDRLAHTEVVYTRAPVRGRPTARPAQRLSTA
ncbi:MAG TPA: RDD family protein [Polyangia bacterium]|nr:RDD family protein [Polyangia bacterium]